MQAIEGRLLRLMVWLQAVYGDERAQTATEYVAVTAGALMVALVVVWAVLGGTLEGTIGALTSKLVSFVTSTSSVP